jgi:hypothetical protein
MLFFSADQIPLFYGTVMSTAKPIPSQLIQSAHLYPFFYEIPYPVAYPEIFSGGVQQIQLTEGRENRDLGAVAPQSGVPPNLQMGETRILIRFLGCIFHGTGNSARLWQNVGIISEGGGLNPPNPPLGTPVTVPFCQFCFGLQNRPTDY